MVTKIEPKTKLDLPLNNCEECPLYNKARFSPHHQWGNLNHPHVLFIGEAPGATEQETGKAFQGRAGKWLQSRLRKFQIGDFAVANAVCCRPTQMNDFTGKLKDRKPSSTELKHCKDNFDAIIEEIKPKYIVALGNVAMKRLKIKGSITSNRGVIHETPYGPVFPMFHPAYILRSPGFAKDFDQDLEVLANILSGTKMVTKEIVETEIVDTINGVYDLTEYLLNATHFAFDIETDDLVFYRNLIMGIGFCCKEGEAFYVPLRHPGTKELFWEGNQHGKVLDMLVEIMTDPNSKKIAHNGKFDIKNIEHHWACRVENFWADTMLMHYLLEENKRHGLKELAGSYFPEMRGYNADLKEAISVSEFDDEKFGGVPIPVLGQYCGMDCEVTFRLAKIFANELAAQPKLLRLWTHLYRPLSRIYADSEKLGVKIDIPYVKKLETKYTKLAADKLKEVYGFAGEEFNLNSSQQVGKVLYDKLNFPILIKTAGGAPSTAEGTLKMLPKNHPSYAIIDALLKYRGYTKMLSTYLTPMIEKADSYGRIHPSFLLHGTVSGRLSSKGPNIQNIPRDPEIKGMIIAEEGYTLVEIDYSQAELRVMSYYSKDPEMTRQYLNDEDIHLATASTIFHKAPKDITKQERKYAKLTNFGGMYGASPQKLMTSINEKLEAADRKVTLAEAERFRAGFFKRYTGIGRFIKKVHKHIHAYQEVESIFGRKRRLPTIKSAYQDKQAEALREGLNALIQGTASDLTQISVIRVANILASIKSRFLFTVHDAMILEVHNSELSRVPDFKHLMEKPIDPFDFPIIADAEKFPVRWGNDSEVVL